MKLIPRIYITVLKPTIMLAAVAGVLITAGLACGGSAKPAPPDYVGSWTGDDQSTLTIQAEGRGSYKSANSSVNGGTVTIDETAKTLKISFVGIGPSFTIDKTPADGRMTLSGIQYTKSGPNSSQSRLPRTENTSGGEGSKTTELPSDKDVEGLVRSSISDLAKAVESDDFSDLYDNASSDFRGTYTLVQVQDNFRPYVEKKELVLPILRQAEGLDAEFSPAVTVRTEKGLRILVANGTFETTPQKLRFETEYVNRAGEWRMLALVLNIR